MDGQKIHEKTGEDRKGEKCFLNVKVLFVNYKSASCNQGVLGGISIYLFVCLHACACMSAYMYDVITMFSICIDSPNHFSNLWSFQDPDWGSQCERLRVEKSMSAPIHS